MSASPQEGSVAVVGAVVTAEDVMEGYSEMLRGFILKGMGYEAMKGVLGLTEGLCSFSQLEAETPAILVAKHVHAADPETARAVGVVVGAQVDSYYFVSPTHKLTTVFDDNLKHENELMDDGNYPELVEWRRTKANRFYLESTEPDEERLHVFASMLRNARV